MTRFGHRVPGHRPRHAWPTLSLAGLWAALLLAVLAAPLEAQQHPNHAKGFSPEKAYQLLDVDAVNVFNGNLAVTLPLGFSYPVGEHLSYGLSLVYGGNVWEFEEINEPNLSENPFRAVPGRRDNAGLGWRLSLGLLLDPDHEWNSGNDWVYVSPDGAERTFYDRLHGEAPAGDKYYTRDGSYLRLSPSAREVHFPDGQVHRFDDEGRLLSMEDPFGNRVSVTYGASSWVITDTEGRRHEVTLSTIAGRQVVTEVRLMAPAGSTSDGWARYRLGIAPRDVTLPPEHTEPEDPPVEHTAVLETLTLPDGSQYRMTTHRGDGVDKSRISGHLTALTLPPGGRIEWSYGDYQFPGNGQARGVEIPLRRSTAVVSRRTYDSGGALLGNWTYDQEVTPSPIGTGPYPDPPRQARVEVTDPLGHVTESFFSVAIEDYNGDGNGWKAAEYGLPFTRNHTDGGNRYLSQRIYESDSSATNPGALLRSTFVRYERDAAGVQGAVNARQVSTRTTYHDDGNKWTSIDRSDFDGFGHFRRETTNGNFQQANFRQTEQDWNPFQGTLPNQSLGGWSNLPTGARWILTNWREASVTEGGTAAKREACFDALGYRTRERVWKRGDQRTADDLVTVWTRDTRGRTIREERYGADLQAIGTGDLCSSSFTQPSYRMDHTWSRGILATSQVSGVNFKSRDYSIDPTGLISASREANGVETETRYDAQGRLTSIRPQDEAWSQVSWHPTARPARVEVKRQVNGSGAALTHEKFSYDGFGRLILEERLEPKDGPGTAAWARRTTTYDGAGNRSTQSVWGWQASPPVTRWKDLDPFGRAREVIPPDGNAHALRFWYAGVRETTTLVPTRVSATGGETTAHWTETQDRQGRLWRVTEPEVDGVRRATTYLYDVGNRLREVTQGAVGSGVEPPPPPPVDTIFRDGFEGGGTGCWSAVVGSLTPGGTCTASGSVNEEATILQKRVFNYL